MFLPRHAAASSCLALACGVVFFASPVRAQQPTVAGVVKNVTAGAVVVREGQELPATPGQTIAEGDTVRTTADGRLGITLKDGTRLALGPNTELRIDSFAYAPAERRLGIALKLLRGVAAYISGHIEHLAPGAVKIETPTSVIGVRGTHLLIGVGQS